MDTYKDLLVARQRRREAVLEDADEDIIESDDEQYSVTNNPIYSKMSTDLYVYIGFSDEKFTLLFSLVEDALQKKGRGRNRKISPQDSFVLLLHYLRCYPPIEQMGIAFNIKPATLQSIIHDTIRICHPILFNHFVVQLRNAQMPQFEAFPNASIIVDATVQPIGRPSGSFKDAKQWYSDKHSMYCLKSQVIINRKGLALFICSGIRGSIHDFRLFKNTAAEIVLFIRSKGLSNMEILADKGYIGSTEYPEIVLITPHKCPKNGLLTPEQNSHNKKLAKVRVLVENYFGRIKNKFNIISVMFRGDNQTYDMFFETCCALANFDIDLAGNSLNGVDGSYFRRTIAADVAKARAEQQKLKEDAKKRSDKRRSSFSHSLNQIQ